MELKKIPSFDVIGSKEKAVAIVEIPGELIPKEKDIAKEIMNRHKNVESVLKKTSKRKGVFRIREHELLTGDPDTEVVHVEYDCKFKLDPQKVYFSVREGTERQRIAEQVKPNEVVLIMFAGVGPYAIVIGKKQSKVEEIIAIEINPNAFSYMKENVRINRLGDKMIPILGDVRDAAKKWMSKCDRVVMPLPEEGWKYLDIAIECLKKGGILHFYSIGIEEDPFSSAEEKIKESAKKLRRKVKILNERKVLPFGVRKWKVCVECRVS